MSIVTTTTRENELAGGELGPGAGAVRRAGPAWHRRVGGLHVMKVKGSFRDMGRQHGELLADAIGRGPLPYFGSYVEKMLRQAGLGSFAPFGRRLLRRTVGRRIARRLPDFAMETLAGVAEGSGLPFDDMIEGCVMPETLLWLVTLSMRAARVGPAVEHRLALGLGCSSAIAWGDATADGKLLHARNFDFHGVGAWPAEAAVIFHEPDDGQTYVSVSSAGVPMGGVQAMNASGLSLAVHQHMFSDQTRLGGVPAGIMGDIVMRRATNLDEAREILESYTPVGCFTYLVADARRREVLCVEESPKRKATLRSRSDDRSFAYANIYFDAELGATEQNLYPSYWRHNLGRQQRLRDLLATGDGTLDPASMAAIMADTGADTSCRIRHAIAMLMNVASVVFSPEDGMLWVAEGETPVSHGRYVPFSLGAEDTAPDVAVLDPAARHDRAAREAFDCYRRAYVASVDEGDDARSRRLLDEARLLAPTESLYHFVAGILALAAVDTGAAETALANAIDRGHPDPERVAAFYLWRGRARDVAGRRAEALADYGTALAASRVDPRVRAAAERGQMKRFSPRKARHVHVEFAFADVVNP